MVTQKDVARELGLSQTAVSLALRNSPGVSRDTIQRVQVTVRRLGYRPDPLLSTLMARRQKRSNVPFRAKIAFLTAFPERDEWTRSNYASGCFKGARQATEQRGYRCEPVWLWEPGIDGKRLSQILWTQGVQGLLVAPLPVDNPPICLDWNKFAAVSLDYSMSEPELHRIVDDHASGMERVLQETASRGYRRPGLVLRASQDVRTHHSRLGVFLVQRRLHPEWEEVEPLIFPADRWDADLFASWVEKERPDVILTEEVELPPAARKLGVRIPRDIGIAFFHKEHPTRQISGLQVDSERVGAIAASILMRMIETNERGCPSVPTITLVKSFFWQSGTTLRPLLRRAAERARSR